MVSMIINLSEIESYTCNIPELKVIIIEEEPVPGWILGDPAYPQIPFLMKEYLLGKNREPSFLVIGYPQLNWLYAFVIYNLSSAWLVV